jgi:hypothetical protein
LSTHGATQPQARSGGERSSTQINQQFKCQQTLTWIFFFFFVLMFPAGDSILKVTLIGKHLCTFQLSSFDFNFDFDLFVDCFVFCCLYFYFSDSFVHHGRGLSHCYRLIYHNIDSAFGPLHVLKLNTTIQNELKQTMGVELR